MAIYKRYNTRRKRINYPLIIWATVIILIFAATVALGSYLGRRAEGAESYLPSGGDSHGMTDTLASVIPHIMQAEYVSPEKLSSFTSEDASVYASTWIFKDGEACFVTEVDRELGKKVDKKPSLDAFSVPTPVSGMFEVGSVYASENVKGILREYERAVLGEISKNGPDETVLVFKSLSEETVDEIIECARLLGGGVIAIPYDSLYQSYFVRFLSAATEHGFTLALMADGVGAHRLCADIDDYAVYFTRDFMRIMLPGKDASLCDVLREKNILNYQFYS